MCTCGELGGTNPDLCDHAVAHDMGRTDVPQRGEITITRAWKLSVGVQRIEFIVNGSRMILKIKVSRQR